MLIDKKIERFVNTVTVFIPASDRAKATRDLTVMVTEMIQDHSGEREPDILDAREVILELGDPENLAITWMESNESTEKENRGFGVLVSFLAQKIPAAAEIGPKKIHSILSSLMSVMAVLAVCLVAFGVLAIGTHVISTMFPIFLGAVFALVAVTGKGVLIRQN